MEGHILQILLLRKICEIREICVTFHPAWRTIICETREICMTFHPAWQTIICEIREICVTSHFMQLCVRNELTMAVSMVMMNWMIVFQVFLFIMF
jgi:hypothetical protein